MDGDGQIAFPSYRQLGEKDLFLSPSVNTLLPMIDTDLTNHGWDAIEILPEKRWILARKLVDIPGVRTE